MHVLLDPWQHGFMQRAALELIMIGVLTGVLGCWIVFYELSYSAESLAHALLPGLVGAPPLRPALSARRGFRPRRSRPRRRARRDDSEHRAGYGRRDRHHDPVRARS